MKGVADGMMAFLNVLEEETKTTFTDEPKLLKKKEKEKSILQFLKDLAQFSIYKRLNIQFLFYFLVIVFAFLTTFNLRTIYQLQKNYSKTNYSTEEFMNESSELKYVKKQFLQLHFDKTNLSAPYLAHNYTNSSHLLAYKTLSRSLAKALKRKHNLRKQLDLINQIEEKSLKALYENWLLDTA